MCAKKKAPEAVENPESKTPEPLKTLRRKIEKNEIIQIQKEGRLIEYDPVTRVGLIRTEARNIKWPGGNCEAA